MFLILCVVGAGVVIGLIYGLWGEDFTIDMSELILKENSVIVNIENKTKIIITGIKPIFILLKKLAPANATIVPICV